jgi:hypothetical protein
MEPAMRCLLAVSVMPWEAFSMDYPDFDQLTRRMTAGASRRSVLRRVVASAMTGPMGFFGIASAQADGNPDDKNKDKKKAKDRNNNRGGDTTGVSVNASGGVATSSSQSNQTVVNANNQVCAGNCAQTNQQVVTMDTTQTTLAGSQEFFGTPPTYWIDVVCTFDAPLYRTICDCTGHGAAGAPPVRKITIPPADVCAFVISEESSVVQEQERTRGGGGEAAGGQANAGNGGVANADASGGSVTVGDVGGDDVNVAIDASGGTASADASGGDNNVAIVGSQAGDDATQLVELSKLTLELEGNVVPGRSTTYWVDTDSGRRPASGPALVQVAEETETTGAIIAEAKMCSIPQPQQGFDWFGQCTAPVTGMSFSLYPESGGSTPLATSDTNAQGRARFGNLPAGTYQLKPEGALGSESMIWCYAESDRVDSNGNIIVEADAESHVWSFTCNQSG